MVFSQDQYFKYFHFLLTFIPPRRCKTCGLTHRTGRKCEKCGGYLLDTIINFGDDLEEDILERAENHAAKTDLVISLGSTMSVSMIVSLYICDSVRFFY